MIQFEGTVRRISLEEDGDMLSVSTRGEKDNQVIYYLGDFDSGNFKPGDRVMVKISLVKP